MLHQISWFNYAAAIFLVAVGYYGYVGLTFYMSELKTCLYRISGRNPRTAPLSGDLQIPEYEVAGAIQKEHVEFVDQEELFFAPPESPNEDSPTTSANNKIADKDDQLLTDFSEMISEVKTLIKVINESEESKGNFEMLFRLIIQKYPALKGTGYMEQINNFLLSEGIAEFSFPLNLIELQNYWLDAGQTEESYENEAA
ncbi:hypothetical protein SNE25_04590 [Mucilaginibacter sabulilitoris]|uniref:Uncharacterized protein n=1 Tax=Mucilaginibacter sabulilitoris TaxID=1173583 RepID=A0ABZ0TNZ8_9SPHI|nr:hypothetical protein [Mucilaginibacter sabulilitoris]WPU94798.1 hypothetical protein SNE25_04590 [Mucilaginibacter sabulilitoris]